MSERAVSGSFGPVAELAAESMELWESCSRAFPELGRCYTSGEQQRREQLLDEFVDGIDREIRATPRSRIDAEETLARVTAAVVQLSTWALDFEHPQMELLLRDGFSRIGTELARWARELDSEVTLIDILQACRNAWTACGLQLLLGQRMQLTPAIFAYSMLYPYSDNYLDDPAISREAKLSFSMRFRRRLAGERLRARALREAIMWQLVGLIESQYPRVEYPQVYDSLLAIHEAQHESIRQMERGLSGGEAEILAISVKKGGTSVLADAYLAAARLTQTEARFAFDWGVLLQLSDDLQDVRQDGRSGSLTLFSRAARREPLDQITNRMFHFAQKAMGEMARLPNGSEMLRELLTRSSRALLMRSAASAPRLFTGAYLRELERYCPFRFEFLRDREKRFGRQRRAYAKLFDVLIEKMLADEGPRFEAGSGIESGEDGIYRSSAGQRSEGTSGISIEA